MVDGIVYTYTNKLHQRAGSHQTNEQPSQWLKNQLTNRLQRARFEKLTYTLSHIYMVWEGGWYWILQESLQEYRNKHSAAEKLVLTSLYWMNMCSRWYTPDLHVGTTDIFLYQGTKVCIPMQQKSVPSVCSQQVTACFRPVFIANCLPASYFLRSPNRYKLLGDTLQPGLLTGCSTTAGRLWHTLTTILISFLVTSISLNCIRRM